MTFTSSQTLQEPVIRRVTLSRYLFELATQNARLDSDVAGAACVNLLQDAIEIFLLAALDHLNAALDVRTSFPQYLDKINERTGDELPFRRRLLEINKVRVLAKHDGIPPNSKEVGGYVADGRKFLEQACNKVLGVDFWSISLVQLVDDNESKKLLVEAETSFGNGRYEDCLIACRKAFYRKFESSYDTQKDLKSAGLLGGSRAPYYARDKKYIEENVATPFDYIVLDHGQVDADLTKEGIDHTAFWNVWRLTPAVYRHNENDDWLVRYEPDKLEQDGLRERASYVLETTVAILLARQANESRVKWTNFGATYPIALRQERTTVYQKADRTGAVAGITREGLTEVRVEYATRGLKDEDIYWKVFHFDKDAPKGETFLSGFILEDDLDFKER